jgi:NTE family protein
MIEIKDDLKIGITLSGGGVRAATFHLGVLKRLADENLLEKIKMISTVSGGSLVTALIYHANHNKWPNSEEFKVKCFPLVKKCLTEKNLQQHAIISGLLSLLFYPFTLLSRGRAGVISDSIRDCWGIKSKLNDIASFPRWNINATTIESGKSWRFIPNGRMGDYILNYVDSPDIKLADAICSSAAVPILIGPFILKTKNYKWFKYDENQKKVDVNPPYEELHIWDGGAYDNLGIEPLLKYQNGLNYRDEINFVIVSDAALVIETSKRSLIRPMRLIDITMDQVRSLRARTLWDHFQNNKHSGVYFKLGESINRIRKNFKLNTMESTSNKLTEERIHELKTYSTTLSKMRVEDFDDLVTHGWEVANTSLVSQCKELFLNKNSQ